VTRLFTSSALGTEFGASLFGGDALACRLHAGDRVADHAAKPHAMVDLRLLTRELELTPRTACNEDIFWIKHHNPPSIPFAMFPVEPH